MNIEIRGDDRRLTADTREVVDRKVRLALGRFASAIRHIRIVVKDMNGPKHGVDQSCAVQVHLCRGGEVHVTAEDAALQNAIDRALERAGRATVRLMQRQHRFHRERAPVMTDQARY